MKRFFLFLILFGTGVGLLLWVQSDPVDPAQTDAVTDGSLFSESVDMLDVPVVDDQKLTGARIGISGRLSMQSFPDEGGAAELIFSAADSSSSNNGWLDLTDVRLDYPGSGVVVAKTGRVALQSGVAFNIDQPGLTLELNDCTLTFENEDAPAVFTCDRIVAQVNERIFTMSGDATLLGYGADLRGDQIEVFMDEERVLLSGNTHGFMAAGDVAPELEITADRLMFTELGGNKVLLNAEGHAKLLSTGKQRFELTAPIVSIEGVRVPPTAPGQQETFLASKLTISGGRGSLVADQARLSGDHFDFQLDEAGQPVSVSVSGSPEGFLPPLSEKPFRLDQEVWIRSSRSIQLQLGSLLHVTALDSSTLGFGDMTLTAGSGFVGQHSVDDGLFKLACTGGVELVGSLPQKQSDVDAVVHYLAQQLDLTMQVIDGQNHMTFVSTGGDSFELTKGPDDRTKFTSNGGLRVELLETDEAINWSTPRADGVTFEVVDSTRFLTGNALKLEDFVPDEFRLTGTELGFKHVDHKDPLAPVTIEAWGAHLSADGLESLSIEGNSGRLASLVTSGVSIGADRLTRDGENFNALGSVQAEFADEETSSVFDCNELLIEGLDLEVKPVRVRRLLATGAVQARTLFAGDLFSMQAEELELLHLEVGENTLHATGGVELGFNQAGEVWTVRCNEVDGLSRDVSDGEPAGFFRLDARGNLAVREHSSGFVGSGESLLLERGAASLLVLNGGDLPAHVRGRIPNQGGVYEGLASEVRAGDESLDVFDLEGTLSNLQFPGQTGDDQSGPVQISCKHFSVSVERLVGEVKDVVQLDGAVHILQEHGELPSDSFRAEHVTFVHQRKPEDEGKRGQTQLAFDPIATSIIAHEGVELLIGSKLDAVGDHLEISSGDHVMRFEGRPAVVMYAGLCWTSPWLQVNPVNMVVQADPGFVIGDPGLELASGEPKK